MHVIAGKAKGRKLLAVPGDGTRPILNRVKTALFDTLRPTLADTIFLDLFAGTGQIGIEALSQGAAYCTFTEMNHKACEIIKKNLETTKLIAQAEIHRIDAFRYLRTTEKTFDIIYVAPPQYKELWLKALSEVDAKPTLLNPDGELVIQIDPREYKPLNCSNFAESRQKRYGNTLILYIKRL
ncbi:MAG: 16S rRNA (guanine(966)-N(2))-methyltransferase RsmD [Bdellovibrionota bacterium]|jgi:16S rRNA (guanine966-N2)-methyltransferase